MNTKLRMSFIPIFTNIGHSPRKERYRRSATIIHVSKLVSVMRRCDLQSLRHQLEARWYKMLLPLRLSKGQKLLTLTDLLRMASGHVKQVIAYNFNSLRCYWMFSCGLVGSSNNRPI